MRDWTQGHRDAGLTLGIIMWRMPGEVSEPLPPQMQRKPFPPCPSPCPSLCVSRGTCLEPEGWEVFVGELDLGPQVRSPYCVESSRGRH